ncbi:MAG: hypothetical protein M0R40_03630 [Firmicutes bacterium]|nr:hypothetical protein [Bacillota bacterium]
MALKMTNIKDYEIYKNGNDYSAPVFYALRDMKAKGSGTLFFPKGVYHFYPNNCVERLLYISNHDSGIKSILFDLDGFQDFTIDADGSEFVFHGRILPFSVQNSANITLKNLSIDYDRPFFTEGEVLYADPKRIALKIDSEKYPYRIDDDVITFYAPEWECSHIKWFVEFDVNTNAITEGMRDTLLKTQRVKAKLVEQNVVEFYADFNQTHNVGNIINITHEYRYNPGVFISKSCNINIENIVVHHAGAMALIAQNSSDILLNGFKTKRSNNRMVTANNDASHFVNCTGLVRLENCYFENQLDDGCNVHGIYNQVLNMYDENIFELGLMHFQQEGVITIKKGDVVAVCDSNTLRHKNYLNVEDVIFINGYRYAIKASLCNDTQVGVGDIIESHLRLPNVEIEGCTFSNNRARGILISTNKSATIKKCLFRSSGTAIKGVGEAKYWYESGALGKLHVFENTFDNCLYCPYGKAVIAIGGEKDNIPNDYFNKSITIENNSFITKGQTVLSALSVEEINFNKNNIKIEGCTNKKNIDDIIDIHIYKVSKTEENTIIQDCI